MVFQPLEMLIKCCSLLLFFLIIRISTPTPLCTPGRTVVAATMTLNWHTHRSWVCLISRNSLVPAENLFAKLYTGIMCLPHSRVFLEPHLYLNMYHIDIFFLIPQHFSSFLFCFVFTGHEVKRGLVSYHFRSSGLIRKSSSQWVSENLVTQFLISKTTRLLEVTEKNTGYKWGKDTNLLTSWSPPSVIYSTLLF